MKLKPKGRKIYRYKTRFQRLKEFFRNSGAVVMTAAGIAVLVFVGYSAGGPIVEFLEEQEIIAPATEPAADLTEPQETASMPAASVEETTIPEETEPPAKQDTMQGYRLAVSALSTEQALRDALAAVPAGTTHVFVPLKERGGALYYATAQQDAAASGAVKAAMPLETIHSVISEADFIPAAVLSTLEDHIYPQTFAEAGYTISGSSERWLDAAPEEEGKPWLSPFSPIAEDYLCCLTAEIADAGFTVILCEDMVFPEFSESDLEMLDPRAGAADRGTSLAQLFSRLQESAGDSALYLGLDGAQVLAGDADILHSGAAIAPDAAVISMPSGMLAQLPAVLTELGSIPGIPQWEDTAQPPADGSCLILQETGQTTEPTEETTDQTEPTETTASEAAAE